jgi:hypothetical protein
VVSLKLKCFYGTLQSTLNLQDSPLTLTFYFGHNTEY